MKKYYIRAVVVMVLAVATMSGLEMKSAIAGTNDTEIANAFAEKYKSVIKTIQNNPDYKRIPLDAEIDQDWFLKQIFQLWNKKMTKTQFVEQGVNRFPGFKGSFEFLADKFLD